MVDLGHKGKKAEKNALESDNAYPGVKTAYAQHKQIGKYEYDHGYFEN